MQLQAVVNRYSASAGTCWRAEQRPTAPAIAYNCPEHMFASFPARLKCPELLCAVAAVPFGAPEP
eukprot:2779806-Alexandrium_andersonii.AAC.1